MPRSKKAAEGPAQDVVMAPPDGTFGYICNWAVKHNGRRYKPGEKIEVDAKTAASLIESGAIRAQ